MAVAGRVLMIPAGTWISGTNYEMLDVVIYAGSSYVAKKQINNSTVAPPSATADWQLLAQGFDVTNVVTKSMIANNFLATDPNTVLSGPMGKSLKEQLDTTNSNLTTLNNKILLDSSYLVIKQVALPSGSSGNDWVNVSLSQMNISGKKIPDICAPMACISWNVGTAFWVTYCTKYDDTTLQVRFNSPISTAFRVTLMFELVNAS